MRKKKILLLFWVLVLILAVGAEAMLIKSSSLNWYKKVRMAEYGLEISYPRAYADIENEESNYERISSTISSTITETDKNSGISVDLVKELVHAKSSSSMITLLIEGIKKDKTTKSIEDICRDHITMFRIYNENLDIASTNYQEVEVNGVKGGRVEIYTYGKRSLVYPGIISYLFPLDDREITITFTGTKEIFENHKNEIDKIINSVQFIECE
ncbi:MAG: hypothetical protein IJ215_04885 [Clostridia bacterium]|nr:hypothetical protein [Clostridia bacterium]